MELTEIHLMRRLELPLQSLQARNLRVTAVDQLFFLGSVCVYLVTNLLIAATHFSYFRHSFLCLWRYSTKTELGKLSVKDIWFLLQ